VPRLCSKQAVVNFEEVEHSRTLASLLWLVRLLLARSRRSSHERMAAAAKGRSEVSGVMSTVRRLASAHPDTETQMHTGRWTHTQTDTPISMLESQRYIPRNPTRCVLEGFRRRRDPSRPRGSMRRLPCAVAGQVTCDAGKLARPSYVVPRC
jgi:hypothetical protein